MINALIKQERLFWGKLLCFCTVDFYYFKHRILCLKERRPANFLVYFAFASPSGRGWVKFSHIAAVSLTPNFTVQSLCCFYHWKKKRNGGNSKCCGPLKLTKSAKGFSSWSGEETGEKLSSGLLLYFFSLLERNSAETLSGSGVQFLAQPLRKTRVINSPCPPGSPACLPSLFSWGQPMLFRARLSQPR